MGDEKKYDKLFLALMGASSAHADASRKEFVKLGLTEGQPKILYILRRGEGLVQKELAELCGVRQPTLTSLLSRMEEKKLTYRERCLVSGGKNAYRVYLTEAGRAMADRLEQVVEGLEDKGFSDFSEEERENLLYLLGRVEKNMRLS